MTELKRIEETLSDDVRRRLLAMRNVLAVGPGFKTVGGTLTHQLAIVVQVDRKLPRRQLRRGDFVPASINGVPTDIEPAIDARFLRPGQEVAADSHRERPLVSGCAIGVTGSHTGTLGFFARRNSDSKPVLVSNYHVLYRGRAMLDITGEPHECFQPPKGTDNKVGNVAGGDVGGEIDCAYAVLDEEGSSCCCMSVIKHENRIGTTQLVGIEHAQVGDIVRKTGRTTGTTVGKIVSVNKAINGAVDYSEYELPKGDSFTFSNLIMVVSWDEVNSQFLPLVPFADPGDSGSALIVGNKIVGLHFMSYTGNNGNRYSFSCHVTKVETTLQVTVPGTRPTLAAGGGSSTPAIALLDQPVDPSEGEIMIAGTRFPAAPVRLAWAKMAERLHSSPSGRAWFELVANHHYEVMRLINRCRPVTIAWQRGKGPPWMAAFVRSATHLHYRLPAEVEGETMAAVTARIRAALAEAGDEALARDLDRNGGILRDHLCKARSAWDLIDRLCASPPLEPELESAERCHA